MPKNAGTITKSALTANGITTAATTEEKTRESFRNTVVLSAVPAKTSMENTATFTHAVRRDHDPIAKPVVHAKKTTRKYSRIVTNVTRTM